MAVMEASASGLPVVASDVGGTREIVEHGVTGALVAPRSSEQIAVEVLRLLQSPERAAALGANGVRRMREQFSLDSCAERHREIYWAAIARAGARAPALAGV